MIINNFELVVEIYTVLLFSLTVNILASRISCFGPSLLNILSLNSSNYSEPILDKDKLLFPRKTHAHAATSKTCVYLCMLCSYNPMQALLMQYGFYETQANMLGVKRHVLDPPQGAICDHKNSTYPSSNPGHRLLFLDSNSSGR